MMPLGQNTHRNMKLACMIVADPPVYILYIYIYLIYLQSMAGYINFI